jgi:glycosyltransferase involved in cell wall biosynthesis
MRIAIATNSLLPADKEGGPAHSSFYLAKALRSAGSDVRVVTTDRNGPERLTVPLDRWTERDGVPVFYASTRNGAWLRSPTYAKAIRFAVERSDVCLMSGIFWNYTGLVAASACRRLNIPYLTLPRGLLSPWALRHKGLKKRLYWTLLAERIVSRSAAIIALARQEFEDIRAVHLSVPIHIIPNGACVEEMSSVELSEPSRRSGNSPYILFLGRIHAKKGLDILVPAFEQIARSSPHVSLVIAGTVDAAYARQFEGLLSENSARDRIRLTGNVSGADKARLLAGASIFVLTSHSEGLPVAVLEALSAGLPVVITPGCNLPEVAAAHAGIEVAPEVQSTAAALMTLVADPELRSEMGSNARKLARESFSWQGVARRVLELCRSITKEGPPLTVTQPKVDHDATLR